MEIALLFFALAVLVFAIGGVILVRRTGKRPDPPARGGPVSPPNPPGYPPSGDYPVGPPAGSETAGGPPVPAAEPAASDGYISLYTFQPREDGWRCPNCDGENPPGESRCRICGRLRV